MSIIIGIDRTAGRAGSLAGGVLFAVAALASPAVAGAEYCVTCAEPAANYRCQVDRRGASVSPGALQLYCIRQLAAVGNHARCSVKRRLTSPCHGEMRQLVYGPLNGSTGPTLSIGTPSSAPSSATLSGAPVVLDPSTNSPSNSISRDEPDSPVYPGIAGVPPSGQPAGTMAPPQADVSEAPPKVKKGPPKTVAEMAKRAASASKRQMKKAGDVVTGAVKKTGQTVGDAASKTWNCLVSLFSKC